MRAVEGRDLTTDIRATTTDEYSDLIRGFNLMVGTLREEVQILQLAQPRGRAELDTLLARIMHETSTCSTADRSTLFRRPKTNELFSRGRAEGISTKEIRIPVTSGIAASVFTREPPRTSPTRTPIQA
jgi:adenylate cyclase